jgi:hypothetical protein
MSQWKVQQATRSPRVACPNFPVLPAVPQMVDPDRWLQRVNGQSFARKVQTDGSAASRWTSEYLGSHEYFGSDHSQDGLESPLECAQQQFSCRSEPD